MYAETLLRRAEKDDAVDAVTESIERFAEVLDSHPRFVELLEAPRLSAQEKKGVVTRVFENRLHPVVLGFVGLVIDRQREALLSNIASTWQTLADERANRQTATVTAVEPIEEKTLEGIRKALEKATGKHISIEEQQDPSLLGGIVVRTGDLVMDASLRSRLGQLGRRLRSSSTH